MSTGQKNGIKNGGCGSKNGFKSKKKKENQRPMTAQHKNKELIEILNKSFLKFGLPQESRKMRWKLGRKIEEKQVQVWLILPTLVCKSKLKIQEESVDVVCSVSFTSAKLSGGINTNDGEFQIPFSSCFNRCDGDGWVCVPCLQSEEW